MEASGGEDADRIAAPATEIGGGMVDEGGGMVDEGGEGAESDVVVVTHTEGDDTR